MRTDLVLQHVVRDMKKARGSLGLVFNRFSWKQAAMCFSSWTAVMRRATIFETRLRIKVQKKFSLLARWKIKPRVSYTILSPDD